MINLGKYFDFPFVQGKAIRAMFMDILLKIQNCMASLKGHLLNRAGRICLAQSIITAIPSYYMQAMWFPSSVCNDIDSIVKRFIWSSRDNGRSLNLVNWETISSPKRYDGLGIQEARLMNVSIMGKLN